MQRKIFISINLPGIVKKKLVLATEKWQKLPVKWVREENLHVTLLFLGYIDDDTTEKICEIVKDALGKEKFFDIDFDRIELAPKDDPSQIWLVGGSSEQLRELHEKIEKALDIFKAPKKTFRPHVTLGRLRKAKWEEMPKKPEIEKDFPLNISVESIDIMASHFEGNGSKYTVIEGCPLN